ncbi:MAG: hypothetical protein ABIL58_02610 [Pseudomonadota bacterium]
MNAHSFINDRVRLSRENKFAIKIRIVFKGAIDHQPSGNGVFPTNIRTCLKKRVFGSDQGDGKHQPSGILVYFEDLMRGFNADMGQKDFFEIGSIIVLSVDQAPSNWEASTR